MHNLQREAFTSRLNQAAIAKGLYRPTKVARKAGLSPITVAAYMRGTRGCSYEQCVALGLALECDPAWLYAMDVEEANPILQGPAYDDTARPVDDLTASECLDAVKYYMGHFFSKMEKQVA